DEINPVLDDFAIPGPILWVIAVFEGHVHPPNDRSATGHGSRAPRGTRFSTLGRLGFGYSPLAGDERTERCDDRVESILEKAFDALVKLAPLVVDRPQQAGFDQMLAKHRVDALSAFVRVSLAEFVEVCPRRTVLDGSVRRVGERREVRESASDAFLQVGPQFLDPGPFPRDEVMELNIWLIGFGLEQASHRDELPRIEVARAAAAQDR